VSEVKKWFRDWYRRLLKGGVDHLVWELEAVKTAAPARRAV
jgi:hypothetical protein